MDGLPKTFWAWVLLPLLSLPSTTGTDCIIYKIHGLRGELAEEIVFSTIVPRRLTIFGVVLYPN